MENKDYDCTTCTERDNCKSYKMLNKCLDKSLNYLEVSLSVKLLINPQHLTQIKDNYATIARALAEISKDSGVATEDFFTTYLIDADRVHSLGGEVKIEQLTNKEAFTKLSNHIKDMHKYASNR